MEALRLIKNGMDPKLAMKMGSLKLDLFSDFRDQAFDYVGLDKGTREQLQPVVDQAKVLGAKALKTSGPVPNNSQGITGSISFPSELGFMNEKILGIPAWVFVAAIVALVMLMVLKGRK